MESEFFQPKEFIRRLEKFMNTIESKETPYGYIELLGNPWCDIWPLGITRPHLGGFDQIQG